VLEGSMILENDTNNIFHLKSGDAFVIPPKMVTRYSNISDNLELLEVSLPGEFKTEIIRKFNT